MTMADRIAIMSDGRIEQLGTPTDLYERPKTAFVAGFLGVSNLLGAQVAAPDRVRLDDGTSVAVPVATLAGRDGRVAIGIRPEKIRPDGGEANTLSGRVLESAYIGVSTQYLVDTRAGQVTLVVQNDRPGAAPLPDGSELTLSWNPESTFVVDAAEEVPR
jgi:spermidine/putrescine transport system ATP-binding protein